MNTYSSDVQAAVVVETILHKTRTVKVSCANLMRHRDFYEGLSKNPAFGQSTLEDVGFIFGTGFTMKTWTNHLGEVLFQGSTHDAPAPFPKVKGTAMFFEEVKTH